MSITVLLADGHHRFKQELKALLEQDSGISIIAEAGNGVRVVERAIELNADVVVLDMNTLGLKGIEAAGAISKSGQGTKVIILSMHTEKQYVIEALKAGVKGYVSMNCVSTNITAAVHSVAAGNIYLSPTIGGALIDELIKSTEEDCSLSEYAPQ